LSSGGAGRRKDQTIAWKLAYSVGRSFKLRRGTSSRAHRKSVGENAEKRGGEIARENNAKVSIPPKRTIDERDQISKKWVAGLVF